MCFSDDFGISVSFSIFNAVWCAAIAGLILSGVVAFLAAAFVALTVTVVLAPTVAFLVGV